ncbi:hypothetical protein [Virgibacillus sp. Bac332]|uniref:hypothetical protein n=1 Tax=Virgibacillus sp. Bac332 TaxID=2419842 RepID=UPI000EF52800|nr:hypothetical protein [Virgibacillus sp. Bac332]
MKKIFLILIIVFILSACGNDLVHEDIRNDYKQIQEVADEVYESEEGSSEKQQNLYNDFSDKYIMGQFEEENGDIYKMNDLEKDLIYKVQILWGEAITSEFKEELSSEDTYEETKKAIDEYLKLDEIPEDLKGKHPTYELITGYPDKFIKDTNELFDTLDSEINSEDPVFTENEYIPLENYINKYKGVDFEHDGKYYRIDEELWDIVDLFKDIQLEVDDGYLRNETIDEFNIRKDTWK